jgi:hypothetical protein
MSMKPSPVRRREIATGDIGAIIDLLTAGFRTDKRQRSFWERAQARLSEHRTPLGYPKYGYLLEHDGTPVGVILMIYSTIITGGRPHIRCSISSWYVKPTFRPYASLLTSQVFQQQEVTFFNITPVYNTYTLAQVMGYRRYCSGRFVAVPLLARRFRGVRVQAVTTDISADDSLSSFETQLLLDHRSYGCISVTCSSAGRRHPFVFRRHRKAGLALFAILAYCRNLEDFVRFARPLGRYLALRGMPVVVVDANGPIAGLPGRYFDGSPKYFRGPEPPRLGDMAYSERVLFDL